MHIIEPERYQPRKHRKSKRPFVIGISLIVVLAGAANYFRPIPQPIATVNISLPSTAGIPTLNWPTRGQAAVAAAGYGLLDTHGTVTPLATASIAKVITALCVLEKEPLAPGQTGPTFTVSADDVALYQSYAAKNGSLIPVTVGEQLTEYQALEALMLPSANNIADSLARWVFGSQSAYATYATLFLQAHNLNNTQIGPDASGFDSGTTSTASDLATLGLLALKSPTLLQIANQSTATLPVAGTVSNYNTVLGVNGITGLKTGNNDTDPGAFLFTATGHVGQVSIPLTGVVMDAPDLNTALQESASLVASLQKGFAYSSITHANQTVGTLRSTWGTSTSIATKNALQLAYWKANLLTEKHQLDTKVRTGTIGSIRITAGETRAQTPLVLTNPLAGPSFWWRLTRH